MNNPKYIMIHTSDLKSSIKNQFSSVNAYHRDQEFPKSSLGFFGGYHVYIENGKRLRYRTDGEEGAHCNFPVNGISMNFQSLSVCFAGDGDIELPSPENMEQLRLQVQEWMKQYNIPPERVVSHRDFNLSGKTCPGTLFTDEIVRSLTVPKSEGQKEKIEELKKKIGILTSLVEALKKLLALLKK